MGAVLHRRGPRAGGSSPPARSDRPRRTRPSTPDGGSRSATNRARRPVAIPSGEPPRRARQPRRGRPPWESRSRTFVQPIVPVGHSASADSEPTVAVGTVSLPPVAVMIVVAVAVSRVSAIAAAAPAIATTAATSSGSITWRGLAGAGPSREAPGSRSPHSRQNSWPTAVPPPQRGHAVTSFTKPLRLHGRRCLVDQRATTARAESGADQQRCAARADRRTATP